MEEKKKRREGGGRGEKATRIRNRAERENQAGRGGSECRHRKRRSTVPEMRGGMVVGGSWVEGGAVVMCQIERFGSGDESETF